MSGIEEFLRARLDEDEHIARRPSTYARARWVYDRETFRVLAPDARDGGVVAARRGRGEDTPPLLDVDGEHIARHDPARVLAEVAAKRRIVELHVVAEFPDTKYGRDKSIEECNECLDDYPCLTLRLLALPYAGDDDYREEFAP